MKVECACVFGPYQDYLGRAEYDADADLFHGQVLGIRDVITFQGRTIPDAEREFRASVDDYLAFCQQRGESPDETFSGKFVARIDPEVHRRLSVLARAAGKSLNRFVSDLLTRASLTDGPTRKPATVAAQEKRANGKKGHRSPRGAAETSARSRRKKSRREIA